ncbi:MAG: helix-turn-helix domain-containing protein, partial [Desulfurococcales archaeon]|nr:helix-turn-helix domain-containing protein [Desulfurococcales archaeon]
VLGAIVSGVTSPSEIMEVTGLSKHRVYAALKSLVEKGVIVKRREGRRVHYLPAEGIPEAATGSPEVEAPA